MFKKITALILISVFTLGLPNTAIAAGTAAPTLQEQEANILKDLGLFRGTDKGFELDRTATRTEAVVFILGMLGVLQEAKSSSFKVPFTDVPSWAAKYVAYAYNKGIASGYSKTFFGGNDPATPRQLSVFILKAFQYTQIGSDYIDSIREDEAEGIATAGKYVPDSMSLTRGDCVSIIYNSLTAVKNTEGVTLAESLVKKGVIDEGKAKSYGLYSEKNATEVPILMYHHLDADKSMGSSTIVSQDDFRDEMLTLKENGYNTIFFKDLYDYVYSGRELPDKPIIITFDDGYESNYKYAYPVLKELGMKATISVIGMSVGKDKYKDTDELIIPHFGYNEAREMYLSGYIDIQSHSYAMHDNKDLEPDCREGVLQKNGESENDYIFAFKQDYLRSRDEIEKGVGNKVFVYTYPFGEYSELTETLLRELGNKITVSTHPGVSTVIKGLPQSLYVLKRINVPCNLSGRGLIDKINSFAHK